MVTLVKRNRNATAGHYYRDQLASPDVTVAEKQEIGQWCGSGAESLGLVGDVAETDFLNLCDNRSPLSGKQLRRSDDGIAFYDLTIAAPKAFSLLALADRRLGPLFRDAIADQWKQIEKAAAILDWRRAPKGCPRVVHTGSLVGARFFHSDSRGMDPHLHAHNVIFALGFDRERGLWLTNDSRPLFLDQRYHKWCVYSRLARGLTTLGYEVVPQESSFSVAGTPPRALACFSKRRTTILAACKDLITERDQLAARPNLTKAERARLRLLTPLGRRGVSNLVALEKRPAKRSIESSILREAQLRQLEPSDREALDQLVVATRGQHAKPKHRYRPYAALLLRAVPAVLDRLCTFRPRDLFAEVCRQNLGNVDPDDLESVKLPPSLEVGPNGTITAPEATATIGSICKHLSPSTADVRARPDRPAPRSNMSEIDLLAGQVAGDMRIVVAAVVSSEAVRRRLPDAIARIRKGLPNSVLTLYDPEFDCEAFQERSDSCIALSDFLKLEKEFQSTVCCISEETFGGPLRAGAIIQRLRETSSRLVITRRRSSPLLPRLVDELRQHGVLHQIDPQRNNSDWGSLTNLHDPDRSDFRAIVRSTLSLDDVHEVGADEARAVAHRHCELFHSGITVATLEPSRSSADEVNSHIRAELKDAETITGSDTVVPMLCEPNLKTPPGRLLAELTQNVTGHFKGERFAVSKLDHVSISVPAHGGETDLPSTRVALYEERQQPIAKGDWLRATKTARGRDGSKVIGGATHRVREIDSAGDIILGRGLRLSRQHGHLDYAYSTYPGQLSARSLDAVVLDLRRVTDTALARDLVLEAGRVARQHVTIIGTELERLLGVPVRTPVSKTVAKTDTPPRAPSLEISSIDGPTLLSKTRDHQENEPDGP